MRIGALFVPANAGKDQEDVADSVQSPAASPLPPSVPVEGSGSTTTGRAVHADSNHPDQLSKLELCSSPYRSQDRLPPLQHTSANSSSAGSQAAVGGSPKAGASLPELAAQVGVPGGQERMHADQVALQVLRCRVACLQSDAGEQEAGSEHAAESAQHARHLLVLELPQLLLQLPPKQPPQPLAVHPVQQLRTSQAHPAAGSQQAADSADSGPASASGEPVPVANVSELMLYVGAADADSLTAACAAPMGKDTAVLSLPSLSFIHCPARRTLVAEALGAGLAELPIAAFDLDISALSVMLEPGQLHMLMSLAEGHQREWHHILGASAEQQSLPARATSPAEPRQRHQQRHNSPVAQEAAPAQAVQAADTSWLQAHGESISISVGSVAVQLRSSDSQAAPVCLDWAGLACQAATFGKHARAATASWQRLALRLADNAADVASPPGSPSEPAARTTLASPAAQRAVNPSFSVASRFGRPPVPGGRGRAQAAGTPPDAPGLRALQSLATAPGAALTRAASLTQSFTRLGSAPANLGASADFRAAIAGLPGLAPQPEESVPARSSLPQAAAAARPPVWPPQLPAVRVLHPSQRSSRQDTESPGSHGSAASSGFVSATSQRRSSSGGASVAASPSAGITSAAFVSASSQRCRSPTAVTPARPDLLTLVGAGSSACSKQQGGDAMARVSLVAQSSAWCQQSSQASRAAKQQLHSTGLALPASQQAPAVMQPAAAGEELAAQGSISALLLRLHLEGWDVAVATMHEFASVVRGHSLQAHSGSVAARPATPPASLAAGAAVASPSCTQAHAEPDSTFQLSLAQLTVELVANSLPGAAELVPSASLGCQLQLSGYHRAAAWHISCLSVPLASLSLALVDPGRNGRREQEGQLLGLAGLAVNMTPAPPPAGLGQLYNASSPGAGSAPQQHAKVHVDRISVWAAQRRVCVAAALAAALAHLGSRPVKASVGAASPELATTSLAEGVKPDVHLAGFLDVSAGQLALLLTAEHGGEVMPVLELAVRRPTMNLAGDTATCTVAANASAMLQLDVFNHEKSGWEPLLESWHLKAGLDVCCCRDSAAPHPTSELQRSLRISAESPLELTASSALPDALSLLRHLASQAQSASQVPAGLVSPSAHLGNGLEDHAGAYRLYNETGADVNYWLASSDLDGSAIRPGEARTIPARESVSISLMNAADSLRGGRYVSTPDSFASAEHAADQAQPASDTGSPLAECADIADSSSSSPGQAGPQVLFFRVGRIGLPCGPVRLDRVQTRMQLGASRTGGMVRVVCEVTRRPYGAFRMVLHSGIQVQNACEVPLALGLQHRFQPNPEELTVLQPGGSTWLPVLHAQQGILRIKPVATGRASEGYDWSEGVPLAALVQRTLRAPAINRLTCEPSYGRASALDFILAAEMNSDGPGWHVALHSPIMVHNALPVPTNVELCARLASGLESTVRLALPPGASAAVHTLSTASAEHLSLQPEGFKWSPYVELRRPRTLTRASSAASQSGISDADEDTFSTDAGSAADNDELDSHVQVEELGEGRNSVPVRVRHEVQRDNGTIVLHLACPLWVYNCIGQPLAVQLAHPVASSGIGLEADTQQADEVPQHWVPPWQGAAAEEPAAQPGAAAGSGHMEDHSSSRPNLAGLGQVLSSAQQQQSPDMLQALPAPAAPRRAGGRQVGLAEGLPHPPTRSLPSRWPSMLGALMVGNGRLRVQLRASTSKAPPGRSFWSQPADLDVHSAVPVPVVLPCPMASETTPTPQNAAYVLSVKATQVEGGDGAVALHVMPRYVLQNNTPLCLQYKQQGTLQERQLAADAQRAVHWPDMRRPLVLCLRIQEAGWLWSGGFGLDTPGNVFIKIRHRDRGITMLARAEVAAADMGVMHVTLEHHPAGFAPYRVDNCTSLTLHLRQEGCPEQEDVLRPYSALDWAWDEPARPHSLLLSLPGARRLGSFQLDKVGSTAHVVAPASRSGGEGECRLVATVHAEGPMRVLTIVDLAVHVGRLLGSADSSSPEVLGWQPWSSGPAPPAKPASQADDEGRASAPGLFWEVEVELAGVGVSLVAAERELLYARARGMRLRATTGRARHTLELVLAALQVDNALQGAAHPVMLAAPHIQRSLMAEALAAAAPSTSAMVRAPALALRAAVWRRKPAGVICVEKAELHVAPFALDIDQQHAVALAAHLRTLLVPSQRETAPHARLHEPGVAQVMGEGVRKQGGSRALYLEHLFISPITITLSFRGSGEGNGVLRLLALVNVEGARVRLGKLDLHHPLLSPAALRDLVISHYVAAWPEVVKLLGNVDVLGDPRSSLAGLGLGVWAFLARPAAGLVGGPQHLAAGVAAGTRSLLTGIVFSISNAVSKSSNAARKMLSAVGIDDMQPGAVAKRARGPLVGDPPAGPGLLAALLRGVAGLPAQAARGADEAGMPGFAVGLLHGARDLVGHPLASLLDTSARAAEAARAKVAGAPPPAVRARAPRHVPANAPLAPYNGTEAAGRQLLREVAGGWFARERFLASCALAAADSFAVITHRHVLHVEKGRLRWALALDDIEAVRRRGSHVLLAALQPAASPADRQLAAPLAGHLPAHASLPVLVGVLPCQEDSLAGHLERLVRRARARAVRRVTRVPQGRLVVQPWPDEGCTAC